MTSAPIQEMAAMFANMTSPASSSKPADDGAASFGNILGNMSVNTDTDMDAESKLNQVRSVVGKETNDLAGNKLKQADDSASSTTTKSSDNDANKDFAQKVSSNDNNTRSDAIKAEDTSVTSDKASEITNQIMIKVADDLDITVEELEDIMETLGLSAMDLANPQNVSLLVANVKADGDMMALVTDEAIRDTVLSINADVAMTLDEASKELGMDVSELMSRIEDSLESSSEEQVPVAEIKASNVNQTEVVKQEVNVTDTQDVNEEEVTTTSPVITEVSSEETESPEYSGTNGFEQKDSFFKNQKDNDVKADNHDNASFVQAVTTENVTNSTAVVNDVPAGNMTSDQAQIIAQVNEIIKSQAKADMSSLEMVLNPQNLGQVNVALSSKEGNVTAQFTTQNELVRAALESQIMQLKENLEQAGVKVTAVEVSVASHEFERNLDEQQSGQEAKEEEERKLRKATRKLNLNDIYADELIEGLEEEEVVTAKMMQADGNSMDYKV